MNVLGSYSFGPAQILFCAAVGAALALVYDVLRCLRILFSFTKKQVFLCDILFCLLTGTAVFLTALAVADGLLRVYQVLCHALGAAVYFLTLGELTGRVAKWVHDRLCAAALFVKKKLLAPVCRAAKMRASRRNAARKQQKNAKKRSAAATNRPKKEKAKSKNRKTSKKRVT